MREKIAQAFEGARDGYATQTTSTGTESASAGAITSKSIVVLKSGYTPIAIAQIKPANTAIGVAYAYLNGNTLYYGLINPTNAAVSTTIAFTVLYKNNDNA
jgi:hypothetical protein